MHIYVVIVNKLQGPQHLEGVLPDDQAVEGALLLIQLVHDAVIQQLEDGHQIALVGEHLQQHHDVLVPQHLFTGREVVQVLASTGFRHLLIHNSCMYSCIRYNKLYVNVIHILHVYHTYTQIISKFKVSLRTVMYTYSIYTVYIICRHIYILYEIQRERNIII